MADPKLRVRASGQGGSGYAIPTRLVDGKPRIVPGVTTVLKSLDKPALNQWYADQTAAYAVTNQIALESRTETEGFNYLRWHANYMLKHYADIGTNVHEWAEAYLKGDWELPELLTEEAQQCADRFLEWVEESGATFHASEITVYNDEDGYAGTLDILAEINGEVYVIDIKTGRGIYTESRMQQAALVKAPIWLKEVDKGTEGAVQYKGGFFVESELPVKPVGAALLHIRPDDFNSQGEFIESFYNVEYITDRLPEYYKGFQACLEMTKQVYNLRRLEKSDDKF